MAKQKGIVRLVGTLEGINFYERKGVAVARKAGGGFTSKAIKNKPSMQRVRENSSEFGRCSTVKKEFRLGLMPFLLDVRDGSLHGRMVQLFQKIKTLDVVNIRGSRTVAQGMTTAMGRKLLTDFEFTPLCSVPRVLKGNAHFEWNTFTYSFTGFDSSTVVWPQGASHLRVQLGLLCFDFESLTSTLYSSDPLFIDADSLTTDFILNLTEPPIASGTRIAVLGLRFYQEVDGELYVFNEERSVGLEVLGVSSE